MLTTTPTVTLADDRTHPLERLSGWVERVTFHREDSGFCVLRVKVRGHRELVTVIGSAASVTNRTPSVDDVEGSITLQRGPWRLAWIDPGAATGF